MKRLLVFPVLILSLFLGGLAIPTADAFDVNDPPPEVAATWEGAHFNVNDPPPEVVAT